MSLFEVRQRIKESRSDMWNILPGFPLPGRLLLGPIKSGPELEGAATIGWEISGWQHTLFGLLNTLAGISSTQFEDYVQRAGFFVRA